MSMHPENVICLKNVKEDEKKINKALQMFDIYSHPKTCKDIADNKWLHASMRHAYVYMVGTINK